MCRYIQVRGLLPLILVAVWVCSLLAVEPADLVIRGGKIVTMDERQPQVDALAARGQRIVAVGSVADIQPLIGSKTRVLELSGRVAMPGFIEGHGHFFSLGDSKRKLDLSRAASWDEIVSQVTEAASRTPAGQ